MNMFAGVLLLTFILILGMNSKFVNGRGLFLSLIMEKGDLSGVEWDCEMNNRDLDNLLMIK